MVSCELERSGWKWTKVNQNWNELDQSGPKLIENEGTFFFFGGTKMKELVYET